MKNLPGLRLAIYSFLSFFNFGATACRESAPTGAALMQQWQVVSMRRPNSTLQLYPVKPYLLQFKSPGAFWLKLDANTCEGDYTVSAAGNIKINRVACTEICCDSDIAQEVASLLHHVNTYTIQFDVLTLRGIGELKLKRVN